MKVYKIFLMSLSLFCGAGITLGYQQQGFSQYEELSGGVSFICKDECTITLGGKNEMDYLYLSGVINGSGVIGYGFYVGDEFKFLDKLNFTPTFSINKVSDLMVYNRCFNLSSSNLMLFMSGDVRGNLYLQMGKLPLYKKIALAWDFFWDFEQNYQRSLNFRQGVFIRGISIVKYGYAMFIMISLSILFLKKGRQKYKLIFYVGLGLFLFIGIRNTITYTVYLKQGLIEFKSNKTFFDFGDYFSFVDKVRIKLDLDSKEYSELNCKIQMEFNEDFDYGPVDIYFEPCQIAKTGDYVDYKIYYKKEIPIEDLDKKVLLYYNGSYLLENKSK